MATLLFPELARELASSNRRVADSLEAESRHLEDSQRTAEELRALKRRAARSARSAVAATLSRKAEVLDLWQSARDRLKDGLGGGQSSEMFQDVREVVDSWLRLARNSQDILRFAAEVGNPGEGLQELRTAEEEVKNVQAAVESMSEFFTRARPPVDAALLARGRAEIDRGRYRTSQQIRTDARADEGRE